MAEIQRFSRQHYQLGKFYSSGVVTPLDFRMLLNKAVADLNSSDSRFRSICIHPFFVVSTKPCQMFLSVTV